MPLYLIFALLALPLGCACIYLASPNQRWRGKALAARPARLIGAALLAFSLFALTQVMQPLTASFVFATGAMLIFAALPYLSALRKPHTPSRDAP